MNPAVKKTFYWVKESVLLNLAEFSISGLQQETGIHFAKEDRWILNEFFDPQGRKRAFEEAALSIFIMDTLCFGYFSLIKPRLYNPEAPNRNDLFFVVSFLFYHLEKCLIGEMNEPVLPCQRLLDEKMETLWRKERAQSDTRDAIREIGEITTLVREIKRDFLQFQIPGYFERDIGSYVGITACIPYKTTNWEGFLRRVCGAGQVEIYSGETANLSWQLHVDDRGVGFVKAAIHDLAGLRDAFVFEKERAAGLLDNSGFMAKAPLGKIQEEQQKLVKYETLLYQIDNTEKKYKNLLSG